MQRRNFVDTFRAGHKIPDPPGRRRWDCYSISLVGEWQEWHELEMTATKIKKNKTMARKERKLYI